MAFERTLLLELAKRTLYLLVALFLMLTFIFFSFFVLPGDPQQTIVPKTGDQFLREAVVEDLKLNDSILEQYANFMAKMLSGEFFISTGVMKYADVKDFIYEPAGRTLLEFGVVVVSSMVLGFLFGRLLSSRPRSFPKRQLELIFVLIFTVPPALLAERLIIDAGSSDMFTYETMRAVGMVVVVMACVPIASCGYSLIVRSTILEKLPPVLDRLGVGHVPKQMHLAGTLPALEPLSRTWMAWVMACVLLAEIPANSRGLGSLMWDAVNTRDFPSLMVCIFLISLIVLLSSFVLGLVFTFASRRTSSGSVSPDVAQPPHISSRDHSIPYPVPEQPALGLGRFWTEYKSSVSGMIVFFLLLAALVLALAAPIIATVQDPDQVENHEPNVMSDDWRNPLPPSFTASPYTGFVHPLGTDASGGDVFSMMLYGAREYLLGAFGIVCLSMLVGVLMWLVAVGMVKGSIAFARVGAAVCTVVADAIIALPLVLLALPRLCTVRADSFQLTFLLIGVVGFAWAVMTKKTIAHFSSAREKVSQASSELQGVSQISTPFLKTLLEGAVHTLHATKFVTVIGLFSMVALQFIGLGDPNVIAWGQMLHFSWSASDMLTGSWWTYMPPAIAVTVVTASIYVMIDSIEHALRRMITPAVPAAASLVSPSSSSPQAP